MSILDVASEFLTPAEASVVADVAVRDVYRVMDEHIIPVEFYRLGEKRRIRASACPLINFYFHSASDLSLTLRESVIARVCEREELEKTVELLFLAYAKAPTSLVEEVTFEINNSIWREIESSWEIVDKYLTLSFAPFLGETAKRLVALKEAAHLVVEDPEILSGTPVIRGTRVPVYDVAASVASGTSKERIRAAYPSIDDRAIELATLYAEATPPRGRPREAKTGPAARVSKRIPRRAKK